MNAEDRPKPANDPLPAPEGAMLDSPIEADNLEAAAPSLSAELEAAKSEIAALKDQLLRAMAETENTRRRAQREREDAAKFGVTAFARDLLGVADNLRRALDAVSPERLAEDEALKNLHDGIAATMREFDAAFSRQSIRRLWPMGEKFDSHLHQAMFEMPSATEAPGTIVQVLQAGYTLHERLLRPAMVGVAKASAPTAPIEPTETPGSPNF